MNHCAQTMNHCVQNTDNGFKNMNHGVGTMSDGFQTMRNGFQSFRLELVMLVAMMMEMIVVIYCCHSKIQAVRLGS